jgi:hypothetical protein
VERRARSSGLSKIGAVVAQCGAGAVGSMYINILYRDRASTSVFGPRRILWVEGKAGGTGLKRSKREGGGWIGVSFVVPRKQRGSIATFAERKATNAAVAVWTVHALRVSMLRKCPAAATRLVPSSGTLFWSPPNDRSTRQEVREVAFLRLPSRATSCLRVERRRRPDVPGSFRSFCPRFRCNPPRFRSPSRK